MTIQSVGVVGAGVMGGGVAQNLAQTGHQVILLDISDEALTKARTTIQQNLRFQGLFKKDAPLQNPDEVLGRITFTQDYDLLNTVEYVIENVVEKWAIKQAVYAQLDSICQPACLFAANTSAIPITQIASATRRPSQVVGIHFMNPVPLKSMVEVIRGYHTSESTLAQTTALLTRLGKTWVLVNDSPGFVSNRVLMLMINEAVFLVHEQVAAAEEVDKVFTGCFGHKTGPLATADLIGLDTILLSLEVLYENFNDSKYRPCPLLKKMVAAGLHGRKSGQGFYAYH
jgi:3-hydroxybutyryl-CoA dehydrogenase